MWDGTTEQIAYKGRSFVTCKSLPTAERITRGKCRGNTLASLCARNRFDFFERLEKIIESRLFTSRLDVRRNSVNMNTSVRFYITSKSEFGKLVMKLTHEHHTGRT
jgi:hypothetical protein